MCRRSLETPGVAAAPVEILKRLEGSCPNGFVCSFSSRSTIASTSNLSFWMQVLPSSGCLNCVRSWTRIVSCNYLVFCCQVVVRHCPKWEAEAFCPSCSLCVVVDCFFCSLVHCDSPKWVASSELHRSCLVGDAGTSQDTLVQAVSSVQVGTLHRSPCPKRAPGDHSLDACQVKIPVALPATSQPPKQDVHHVDVQLPEPC